MAMLHHWNDDINPSVEELREQYIIKVENDPMASLNEIRRVHEASDYLTAEEFCEKYHLH